ncbi:MAG: DUF6684 family protein [Halorientalis sp.]
MNLTPFDRDTLLDLTVNVIPLGILAFFVATFLVVNPFGWDPVISTIQFAIVVGMFALLTLLTYYASLAISRAEEAAGVEAEGGLVEHTPEDAEADPEPTEDATD